jgi:putative endonuclease
MSTGQRGEDVAAAYLEEQGWRVLDRNYRYERAEIDLVCFEPMGRSEAHPAGDGGEIVVVEVKARTGLGFGRPEEAVTPQKQRHVARATAAYLHERQLENARVRFDVVGVLLRPGRAPEVEHFRDAFQAGE